MNFICPVPHTVISPYIHIWFIINGWQLFSTQPQILRNWFHLLLYLAFITFTISDPNSIFFFFNGLVSASKSENLGLNRCWKSFSVVVSRFGGCGRVIYDKYMICKNSVQFNTFYIRSTLILSKKKNDFSIKKKLYLILTLEPAIAASIDKNKWILPYIFFSSQILSVRQLSCTDMTIHANFVTKWRRRTYFIRHNGIIQFQRNWFNWVNWAVLLDITSMQNRFFFFFK